MAIHTERLFTRLSLPSAPRPRVARGVAAAPRSNATDTLRRLRRSVTVLPMSELMMIDATRTSGRIQLASELRSRG
eukprot:2258954-Pleurochrysis_carterae.AAC.1